MSTADYADLSVITNFEASCTSTYTGTPSTEESLPILTRELSALRSSVNSLLKQDPAALQDCVRETPKERKERQQAWARKEKSEKMFLARFLPAWNSATKAHSRPGIDNIRMDAMIALFMETRSAPCVESRRGAIDSCLARGEQGYTELIKYFESLWMDIHAELISDDEVHVYNERILQHGKRLKTFV